MIHGFSQLCIFFTVLHCKQGNNRSYYITDLQKQLTDALTEPVESLFEAGGKDTWASIRKLLEHEMELAVSGLTADFVSFELDKATIDKVVQNMREYARNIVEKKAREESGKVLIRMKDR